MKCIQCATDNTLKDRTDHSGCCKSCNHRFAFEPTTMTAGIKVTDPMFKKTIDDLSANNTLFFTPKQLAYFLDRRLRRSPAINGAGCLSILIYLFANAWFTLMFGGFVRTFLSTITSAIGILLPKGFFFVVANFVLQALVIWWLFSRSTSKKLDGRGRRSSARNLRKIGFLVLFLGLPVTLFLVPSFILFIAAVGLGMGAIYLGNRQLAQPPVSQEFLFQLQDFQGWLNRWQEVNGAVVKQLPAPRQQTENVTINPDVTAYSFDRLVVCDSAEIAQMLIANNFHFEHNCAVLSITGYPQDIFTTTMAMLRRNPELKVYALHDCSPRGIGLGQRLRTSDRWFQHSNIAIIDVGLTPRQVMSVNGLFVQMSAESAQAAQQVPPDQWVGLSAAEVQWLEAGNYVELESFPPQRLLQVLNRGIAGSRDLLAENDTYVMVGGSDSYIYGSESFG